MVIRCVLPLILIPRWYSSHDQLLLPCLQLHVLGFTLHALLNAMVHGGKAKSAGSIAPDKTKGSSSRPEPVIDDDDDGQQDDAAAMSTGMTAGLAAFRVGCLDDVCGELSQYLADELVNEVAAQKEVEAIKQSFKEARHNKVMLSSH